jgi:hypothetical protein
MGNMEPAIVSRRLLSALLRAVVSRNPLVPYEPAWLRSADHGFRGGALYIQNGAWLAVKAVRVVPLDLVIATQRAALKSRAITSGLLMILSVAGAGRLLASLEVFDPTGPHMMLDAFMLALMPVFAVAVFRVRRDFRILKTLPEANLSDQARSDVRKVNAGILLFGIVAALATAIIEFKKGSAGSNGNETLEFGRPSRDQEARSRGRSLSSKRLTRSRIPKLRPTAWGWSAHPT